MHFSFDFDYTLADSSEGTIICFNYALRQLGYAARSNDEIRKTIGLSLPKALSFFIPNLSERVSDKFTQLFKEKADEVMLNTIKFYDVVENTLSTLKTNGHYISIVSTKYHYRIEAALKRDRIFHLVDYIIGGDCVNKFKPDPEGLIKVINLSGIPADKTYFIGDSNSDGECAQRANVKFIAVSTGVTDLHDLKKWKPIKIIKDLTKLMDFVI